MKIRLSDKDIKLPIKSHLPDSGLDIFIPKAFELSSLETKTIDLGFAVAIPEGHAGIIVPRSSISQKGLIIQTAVIDPDYTGNIHLIITNCSKEQIVIEKDTRVCSLVVFSVLNPYIEIVEHLESTTRGCNGLGSTGK